MYGAVTLTGNSAARSCHKNTINSAGQHRSLHHSGSLDKNTVGFFYCRKFWLVIVLSCDYQFCLVISPCLDFQVCLVWSMCIYSPRISIVFCCFIVVTHGWVLFSQVYVQAQVSLLMFKSSSSQSYVLFGLCFVNKTAHVRNSTRLQWTDCYKYTQAHFFFHKRLLVTFIWNHALWSHVY